MRRALVIVVTVSASTGAALACSTFGSTDTSLDASADGPSITPPPAPPPADAASDGTVFFDDFEDGDCTAYSGFAAYVLPSDAGYESARGCLLCRVGVDSGGRPQATRIFTPPTTPGRYEMTYYARKWVGGGAGKYAIASLIVSYPDASVSFEGNTVPITAASFIEVSESGDLRDGGATEGRAIVLGDTAALDDECVLFDAVRVVHEPQ